jgi:hypothetical protein
MDKEKLRALYEKRDEEFYEWREAVATIGIDATLDALGYSKDRNAIWYNVYTGSMERLNDLIVYGTLGENETEEERVEEFAMNLENWMPQEGNSNPVLDASRALTEDAAYEEVKSILRNYVARNNSFESFATDVHSTGGTTPNGSMRVKKGTTVELTLHDHRIFILSLRRVWEEAHREEAQLSLAL